MDPVTGSLVAAGAGQLLGQIGGDIFGAGDRRKAERDREAALEAIKSLMAEMGQSAAQNGDRESAGAQNRALGALEDVYRQGGMDTGSRAALAQALDQAAASERMSRGAITDNFAARGVGGSGAEMAAQLANQQGYAQRSSMTGAQAAGDAAQRALAAMTGAGGLATNARSQDLDKARALDAVQMFNASQRTRKAGMVAGAYGDDAASHDATADRYRAMGAGIGQGVGSVAGYGYGGGFGGGGGGGTGGPVPTPQMLVPDGKGGYVWR